MKRPWAELGLGLTWHDVSLAVEALGGTLIRITVCAQQALILGNKRLFHQRVVAFGALEATFMPVTVFVTKILWRHQIKSIRWACNETSHFLSQVETHLGP